MSFEFEVLYYDLHREVYLPTVLRYMHHSALVQSWKRNGLDGHALKFHSPRADFPGSSDELATVFMMVVRSFLLVSVTFATRCKLILFRISCFSSLAPAFGCRCDGSLIYRASNRTVVVFILA